MDSSFGAECTLRFNGLALNSKQSCSARTPARPMQDGGQNPSCQMTNPPQRWEATSNFLVFGITRNFKIQCFQFFP